MDIHLVYRAEVFKEDGQFVAICPELNVSSFGDSVEEARKSLREAIDLFLEEKIGVRSCNHTIDFMTPPPV